MITNRKMISLKNTMTEYVIKNLKQYILVTLIFLIGILAGVIIVNNYSPDEVEKNSSYIIKFIDNLKQQNDINKAKITINSIKSNIGLAILLWFAGTTVIGMPFVLIMLFIRGIALGYTISSITCAIGTVKSIFFIILSILLKNILFIPAILTIGVSSIKLYKSILKDRRKENIKVEIVKHTIISVMMLGVMILSNIIENNFSFIILQNLIKYF